MNKLISVVGASGVGKTTFVNALAKTGNFATAFEQHDERPFQSLFKQDTKYALANQMDYLLLRAEQEKQLRAADKTGLMDGGLDLDFHGFTRIFRRRGLLTDPSLISAFGFIRSSANCSPTRSHRRAERAATNDRGTTRRPQANQHRVRERRGVDGWIHPRMAGVYIREKILRIDASSEEENYPRATRQLLEWIRSG
ncbi:MAG: deoxynucleoside kinase [Anaerolineales bacterium]